MKKRYILIEFLLIFIFLLIPPLFVTKGQGLSKAASFSPVVLIQFAVALALQLQFTFQIQQKIESKNTRVFTIAFWWSITLGCLMLIFALMQTLALFFESQTLSRNILPSVTSPFGWCFLVFTVATAAFYEEVLYRQFLPEFASIILSEKMNKKWVSTGIEVLSIGIFAFSHRYLGWIPVLNAFACGALLRLCYKKTGSIWTGVASHFTYNITLITFSLLSRS